MNLFASKIIDIQIETTIIFLIILTKIKQKNYVKIHLIF
jgi:hypothetical protein